MKNDRFLLSALVDFPDDCNRLAFTPDLVENLIDRLHWMGVRPGLLELLPERDVGKFRRQLGSDSPDPCEFG